MNLSKVRIVDPIPMAFAWDHMTQIDKEMLLRLVKHDVSDARYSWLVIPKEVRLAVRKEIVRLSDGKSGYVVTGSDYEKTVQQIAQEE